MKLKLTAAFAGLLALAVPSFAADEPAAGGAPAANASKLPPASDKKGLTFEKDIRPLFEASCFGCHGERRQNSGLRLDSLEAALNGARGRGGQTKVIIPGDSEKSPLVLAIARINPRTAMPPAPRGRRGGPGGPPGMGGGTNAAPSGGMAQTNTPGMPPGGGARGPAPKNLTPEEVGLVRAWIDQGAK